MPEECNGALYKMGGALAAIPNENRSPPGTEPLVSGSTPTSKGGYMM